MKTQCPYCKNELNGCSQIDIMILDGDDRATRTYYCTTCQRALSGIEVEKSTYTAVRFDLEELERLVEAGEVSKRPHPTKDIVIYSYTKTFHDEWSETLRWARGLVLDTKGKVIACPFMKFFNYGEIKEEIDYLNKIGMGCRIQEKLDGSLGILFFYDGEWILSTRGSFTSEQAIKGKEILDRVYPAYVGLDRQFTYLFEIIYPENQIVVKYTQELLVLLAIMDPITMEEVDPKSTYIPFMFDKVKTYHMSVDTIIKEMSRPDYCSAEGFVVIYDNGTRVKFKYAEYVKLHKVVSEFKPKHIVELMKEGGNVDELITSLPDEFRQEIIDVVQETESRRMFISMFILNSFDSIKTEDKKMFALENIKQYPEYQGFLFELWKLHYQKGNEITLSFIKGNKHLNDMIYDRILAGLE